MNHSTEWNLVKVKWLGKWEPAKAITPYRVEVICSERAKASRRLQMGTYIYVYSPEWGFRWIDTKQVKWEGDVPQIVLTPPESDYVPPPPKTAKPSCPKAKRKAAKPRSQPTPKAEPVKAAKPKAKPKAQPKPKTQADYVEANRLVLQKAHQHLNRKHYNRAAQLYVQVLNNSPNSVQTNCCNLCLKECEAALKPKDWRQVFARAVQA